MRQALVLVFACLQTGCALVIGVEDTREAKPASISIVAEGITESVTVQLAGAGVSETIVIRDDGDHAFSAAVSPQYTVSVVGGPPCVLGDNATGFTEGQPITVELVCAGATQLTALSYETILGAQPAFAPTQTSYTAIVGELQQSTRITAAARSTNAVITIQGATATSGVASAPITLGAGETMVMVVVDHPASPMLRTTYTLAISRATPASIAGFAVPVARTDMLAGWSVATDGTRYVTGAPNDDSALDPLDLADSGQPNSGAAFVYVRQGTAWTREAALKAPNADSRGIGDRFGWSVAVSGDRAVVGAPFEDSASNNLDDNSLRDAGAAYVFRHEGGAWVFETYLKSPHPVMDGYFGYSVAIEGDTIVVGAYNDDQYVGSTVQLATTGQVHVFHRAGTTWSLEQSLGTDEVTGGFDGLGFSVAISGDRIVAGAYAANRTVLGAGAARVYVRSGGTWTFEAQIEAGAPVLYDYFGAAVAIDGETIVVGAPALIVGTTDLPGSAYVFTRAGGTWQQQTQLTAANGDADDQFGHAVAIAGDRIAVSAWAEDEVGAGITPSPGTNANAAQDAGATYLYKRTNGQWTEHRYIKSPDGEAFDQFGGAVAMSASGVLVIGSVNEDSDGSDWTNNSTNGAGACYVLH